MNFPTEKQILAQTMDMINTHFLANPDSKKTMTELIEEYRPLAEKQWNAFLNPTPICKNPCF